MSKNKMHHTKRMQDLDAAWEREAMDEELDRWKDYKSPYYRFPDLLNEEQLKS